MKRNYALIGTVVVLALLSSGTIGQPDVRWMLEGGEYTSGAGSGAAGQPCTQYTCP